VIGDMITSELKMDILDNKEIIRFIRKEEKVLPRLC
jgi:hypothetical protein